MPLSWLSCSPDTCMAENTWRDMGRREGTGSYCRETGMGGAKWRSMAAGEAVRREYGPRMGSGAE